MIGGAFSVHSITNNRMLFQRHPVSGGNQALGRQDTSRWTAGDPLRPNKFGNRIAIFVGHLAPPSAANSL
jgi:hypothetical protein